MPNSEIIRHPIIEVSVGGTIVEAYPSKFTLSTQMGFHSIVSKLFYPSDFAGGKIGDEITVSLINEDKKDLYFSGVIYSAAVNGKYRELLLTDSYKKLCETDFIAAYRKEKTRVILDDILEAAGISEKNVTCPDLELARFSTQKIPARICIDLLIDALKEHSVENLTYFFDEKDVFHFGTTEDSGKNEGENYSFESGKDILKRGPGRIEVLPHPIRHTQRLTVDEKELVTVRTDLLVSRALSRLTLWVKEAA